MTENKEIQEVEVLSNQVSLPADTIKLAIQQGSDLTLVKEAMLLQFKWEENEARKAYHKAMSEFKAVSIVITKDKENSQYNSKYTTLGNLINTVTPELSKHDLSHSWDIEQNGIIKVTCKMTHKLGHSETASMSAPADKSGSKNPIQEIKSTITYLKTVTFESICGLASSDANLDDDGNSAGVVYINEKQLSQLLDIADNLRDAPTKKTKFLSYMKVKSFDKIPADKFTMALNALNASKAKEQNENN